MEKTSKLTLHCILWLVGWTAGQLGVAGGIYTDIMSSENRKLVFTPRPGPEFGETLPSALNQREKGAIPAVLITECTSLWIWTYYEQTRSFTFEFWWRQNWKSFTQLCLTLHSCALYSNTVLLKLFMQIKLQFYFTFVLVSTSLLKESVIRIEI